LGATRRIKLINLVIALTDACQATTLRLAVSRNNDALIFGVRFCVLKSTYTIPLALHRHTIGRRALQLDQVRADEH
jgi:hypothetical protein